jgi:hypothetical protein
VVSVPSVPSLSYRTISAPVTADDGGETRSFGSSGRGTRRPQSLTPSGAPNDDEGERADAAAWLIDYLTERGGEAPVLELLAEGHRAGFSEDALKRAKAGAKVRSGKADFGGG